MNYCQDAPMLASAAPSGYIGDGEGSDADLIGVTTNLLLSGGLDDSKP